MNTATSLVRGGLAAVLLTVVFIAGCAENDNDIAPVRTTEDAAMLPDAQQRERAPALAGDTAAFAPSQTLTGRPGTIYIEPGPHVQRPESPANPFAGDDRAESEGERLYGWYNCGGCHGPHGGGAIGPNLRDEEWIYGSEPIDIYRSIAEGRPEGMPTWEGKIPARAIWLIVAYIESIGTGDGGSDEITGLGE